MSREQAGSATIQASAAQRDPAALLDDLLAEHHALLDPLQIAALLEGHGLRDQDAAQYGQEDIFALAGLLYGLYGIRCRQSAPIRPTGGVARFAEPSPSLRTLGAAYVRGWFRQAHWWLQMAFLLTRGYALGIDLHFTPFQAMAVAMGIFLSLIVAGGFVQMIGRIGAIYPPEVAGQLFRRVRRVWVLVTLSCTLGIAALGANAGDGGISGLVIAGYFALCGAMWIGLGTLHTLRAPGGTAAATVGGLIGVVFGVEAAGLHMFVAHWLGLAIAAGIAWVWALRLERISARRAPLNPVPRAWTVSMRPYFLYGGFYFVFLVLDRLIGWTFAAAPYLIRFRAAYEIGQAAALAAFFLAVPMLEFIADRAAHRIARAASAFDAFQIEAHNRLLQRHYAQDVGLVLAAFGAGFTAVAALVYGAYGAGIANIFASSGVTEIVFLLASGGYALLAWALLNCLILFSITRPAWVVRALLLALITNAVTGFLLSRTVAYWHSVLGFGAGTAVFALITAYHVVRSLRRMDYYIYAAYEV